jgi:hypothetical protein
MMTARVLRAVVMTAAMVAAFPLLAADQAPQPGAQQTQPQTAVVCLNSGNTYKAGEFACIRACHGERRLARCDVVAEQASWTFISNACPSAMLPPGNDNANMLPIAVAMTPIPLPIEHKMSEMSSAAWMRLTMARQRLALTR